MFGRVITAAASTVDEFVTAASRARNRRARVSNRAESLGHDDRIVWLERFAKLYAPGDSVANPEVFFPATLPINPQRTRVRKFGRGGSVFDVRWQTTSEPFHSEIAEDYLACTENRTASTRLFLHDDRPRPAVILIHGYLGGSFAWEERMWPIAWLHSIGLDVALAVLPFHGPRSDLSRRGKPPAFPGSDPRFTIEGFRQAIIDLRALVGLLRDRGSPAVGALGMSLGGYTTSLLATIEPDLAFAVPMIPLASIADFARDQGRLVGTLEQRAAQHAALDDALRVVSPFTRPPRIARDRMIVIAGEGDRITPMSHAARVAAHFSAPLETFHGGHLLQVGRAEGFRSVARMLARAGLLEPR